MSIEPIITADSDEDTRIIRLNRKKRYLKSYTYQSAADWYALAQEYLECGSHANYAGAMWRARQLDPSIVSAIVPPKIDSPITPFSPAPEVVNIVTVTPPEPDFPFDWEMREDLK